MKISSKTAKIAIGIASVIIIYFLLFNVLLPLLGITVLKGALRNMSKSCQAEQEQRQIVRQADFSDFEMNGYSSDKFASFPVVKVENGYANYDTFYGTVDSFEYFIQYVSKVNDYLWSEKIPYIGQRGKFITGIAWFMHYEFDQDKTPRAIEETNSHEFMVSLDQELFYETRQNESGEEVKSDNGRLRSPICFELNYYAEPVTYSKEGADVSFTYNFQISFINTGLGTSYMVTES